MLVRNGTNITFQRIPDVLNRFVLGFNAPT